MIYYFGGVIEAATNDITQVVDVLNRGLVGVPFQQVDMTMTGFHVNAPTDEPYEEVEQELDLSARQAAIQLASHVEHLLMQNEEARGGPLGSGFLNTEQRLGLKNALDLFRQEVG